MKKKKLCCLMLIFAMVLSGVSCGKKDDTGSASKENREEPKAVSLSILSVGDIMAHSTNITAAKQSDGTYDFTDNYKDVKKYIQDADLALCNVETTFASGTPSGYPMFNAPDELADAIADAGFDVAYTSNNHMMDTGEKGLLRTMDVLQDAGLKTVGSRREGEKTYLVTKVKGVKVGVVSYTYETTTTASKSVTINGNNVSASSIDLINSFNYNDLKTEDYDRIQEDIDGCREDGADIVICYLHWGNEYQTKPDSHQEEMAQQIADDGADIIFASHPHVLQEADVITASDGREVPVVYSMGNFISNQRQETLGNRYTENGMIAQVVVTLRSSDNSIRSESMRIIPTWVDRYQSGSGWAYRIVPLDSGLAENEALALSGHFSRADQAREDAEEMYGDYLDGKTLFTEGGGKESEEEEDAA